MQETQEGQVGPLGQENPLEDMAALSSILAWRIPWTEEAGGLPSPGCKESEHAHTYTIVLLSFLSAIIFLLSCFKYLHL